MKLVDLLRKLARLKKLVDGLCAETEEPPDIKSTIEESREVGRLAKELELAILARALLDASHSQTSS